MNKTIFITISKNNKLYTKHLYYNNKNTFKLLYYPNKNHIMKQKWDRNFRSFIIGSMLGDAHAERRKKNTRIIWATSLKNKPYLDYIYKVINSYTPCNKPKISHRKHKNGTIYSSIGFSTKTHQAFNPIHDYFYNHKNKIIPENLHQVICPLAIAIWFQDDGSKTNNAVRFATNSLPNNQLQYLSDILYWKFGIPTKLHKTGKNTPHQRVIFVPTIYVKQFQYLIKPYIHPIMLYKFPNKILTQDLIPKKNNQKIHQYFDTAWYNQKL